MNSDSYRTHVTRIEKDIADLQKNIANETKKELDKSKQIDSIFKSITKATSPSTVSSRNRQIESYKTDILNIKKKISDFQSKVASKSSELGLKRQELFKAESSERKKFEKEQLTFQQSLKSDLQRQKSQINLAYHANYESTISAKIEMNIEYDFFISHASEDKEKFVESLANGLRDKGFKVWYDDFELKIGDSLRKNIDKGLANSRYGIVIISHSFITKNWPEYELNGMVAREINGQSVVLPIWHEISKDEVMKFSPTLADKVALNTSIHSLGEILEKLGSLVQVPNARLKLESTQVNTTASSKGEN